MKTISDTWDSGNRLTRFHEENIKCEKCDGKGYIDYDDNLCDGGIYEIFCIGRSSIPL